MCRKTSFPIKATPPVRMMLPVAFLALAFCATSHAQERAPSELPAADAPVVTAAATANRVRFTAPNAVVQMRLEIYTEAGQKVLDTEQRGGSVLDWHLQTGAGERVAEGAYVCVLTVKSLSGRLSQKLATVTVATQTTRVQPITATQLNGGQSQAVGPVEINTALVVLPVDSDEAATVLTHNGEEGQLSRSRGALTFRVGDFFSGNDSEQMRLTEDGNLGLGTTKPKARLDVAGMIRAREGFLFSNGSALNVNDKGALTLTNSNGNVVPNVGGTGTQGRLAKWTDNAGTLGDALISESNGSVVVGNAVQTGNIQIFGTAVQDVFAGMGPDPANGPAFNYGYSGSSFGRGSGFFNVRPDASAVAPNPSLRFMTTNVQRMIITNTGNVGIGTTTPGSPLDVAGNINTSTQFNIGGRRVLSIAVFGNTFVGEDTGTNNNTGGSNSFFGNQAGARNTAASDNTFIGRGAGLNNGAGNNLANFNTFVGNTAGETNGTGANNSFFGNAAGLASGGDDNTFVGSSADFDLVSGGSNNTLLGAFTKLITGNGSIPISNATAIGSRAQAEQNNSLVLGSINGVNGATADVRVGIGTTAPVRHLHVKGAGDQEIAIESSDVGGRQWTLQASNGTSSGGRFEIVDRTAVANRMTILSNGMVGIGTTTPGSKLEVASGDVAITTPSKGVILRATDGTNCFRMTVNNAGTLSTASVTCP